MNAPSSFTITTAVAGNGRRKSAVLRTCAGAVVVACCLGACLTPYPLPGSDADVSFLVVDAFMTTGGDATVRLSRAITVDNTTGPPAETNGIVTIQDSRGTTFTLHEDSAGYYSMRGAAVDFATLYRLHVRTAGGAEYLSDNVPLLATPPIDSVTWRTDDDNVVISVNTHDLANKSKYYLWTFDETSEYLAAYYSGLMWKDGQITFRLPDDQIYRCWKTTPSTRILINSTVRLREDRIREFAVNTIRKGDKRISIKYSILVKQRTLTAEAYRFWQQLQNTTETVGGLFDPMASQVTGNVHRVGDSDEPVLGYFSAGEETQARIYIRFTDLPEAFQEPQRYNCTTDTLGEAAVIALDNAYILAGWGQPGLMAYSVAYGACGNCTLLGGKNKPPHWWQ